MHFMPIFLRLFFCGSCSNVFGRTTQFQQIRFHIDLVLLKKMQTNKPSIVDRLHYLFEDPLQLQDLVFKEKCQPLNRPVDFLTIAPKQNTVTVVSLKRLYYTYHSGGLYFRLMMDSRLFVVPPEHVERFANCSVDISTLKDWRSASSLVTQLLNSPFAVDYASRYAMLVYDADLHDWEYVGCVAPLNTEVISNQSLDKPMITSQTPTSQNYDNFPELLVNRNTILKTQLLSLTQH